MTRAEHLQWSKDRANSILDSGGLIENAFASMVSDLKKHDDLRDHSAIQLGMMMLLGGHFSSVDDMRKFINGFN